MKTFVWKRRCAGVRAGTQAPPLRFRLGGLCMGRLMAFGLITCKWLFCLCGMCGKILRSLVGAVPVCPPVSPCKGAFVVHPPRTMRVFLLWKRRCANVRAGTQAPPLRFRLGDCAQTVGFVWADYVWMVDFVWADCAWDG